MQVGGKTFRAARTADHDDHNDCDDEDHDERMMTTAVIIYLDAATPPDPPASMLEAELGHEVTTFPVQRARFLKPITGPQH